MCNYYDNSGMSNTTNQIKPKKHSVFSHVLRFFGWWFGFAELYAMFAVCPFCGQAGCPVGAGTAGLVGGFFALVMKGRTFFSALASMFKRKKRESNVNDHSESVKEQGGMNV